MVIRGGTGVRFAALALLGVLAIWAIGARSAAAVESDIYENFTKCPTSAPAMNDPAKGGALCVSSLVRGGFMRAGNFQSTITSPMHVQFALTADKVEGEPEPEVEPTELNVVPGSTSLDAAPFLIPNPFYKPAQAPAAPSAPPAAKQKKKKQKRKKCKRRQGKQGKQAKRGKKKKCGPKKHKKRAKKPPAPQGFPPLNASIPDYQLVAGTVESAGDVRNLNLEAALGKPEPVYEMPIKLHLQSAELGQSCYIGSDANPIVLAPVSIQEPSSFKFGADPNGFNVEVLSLGGMSLEDDSFTVPGASGCGQVSPVTGQGSLDATINGLIGLPAPAGASKTVLGNLLFEMAASINDGTPPQSGEELQAAFDAAKG